MWELFEPSLSFVVNLKLLFRKQNPVGEHLPCTQETLALVPNTTGNENITELEVKSQPASIFSLKVVF